MELRAKMLRILQEEDKLMEIVKLVGEDILPDDQRLILEVSRVIKIGYLQQNAYHENDAHVSLKKQFKMLQVIDRLYDNCLKCVKKGAPISKVKNDALFYKITTMKYNVPEDKLEMFDDIIKEIDTFYESLENMYGKEVHNA
jgi:V/A-type H+-transporting ATPase subunit A